MLCVVKYFIQHCINIIFLLFLGSRKKNPHTSKALYTGYACVFPYVSSMYCTSCTFLALCVTVHSMRLMIKKTTDSVAVESLLLSKINTEESKI